MALIPCARLGEMHTEVPIENWSNDGKNKVSNMFFGIRTQPT